MLIRPPHGKKVLWQEMLRHELLDALQDRPVVIVPVGSVEQHGPHLPVGTDMILNQGCLELLIERAPADLDIRILPIQQVGKSNEHLWAKGTVTHTAHTLIDSWFELVKRARRFDLES